MHFMLDVGLHLQIIPPPLPLPRNGVKAMAIPMTFLEDWLLVRMIDKYNLVRFLYTVLSNKKLITAIISKKKKKKKKKK